MQCFMICGLFSPSAGCARFGDDCVHEEALTLNGILLQ